MKNRKFIKKIIFSILLLLCVCVPFLLHKNNVKAETNIIDLTGMTVTVPAGWSCNSGDAIFNVDINNKYHLLMGYTVSESGFGLNYMPLADSIILTKYQDIPQEGEYRIYESISSLDFTITGGTDVTDQTLIQWFVDNNATFSGGSTPGPDPDPTYTISGQYQFNEEIIWLYDISEQEGVLYLPFYVYNLDNSNRVNYDYMVNKYNEVDQGNDFLYANETASGTFFGQVAGFFTTSTTVRMRSAERIVYFYTAEVSEDVYNWLLANGQFINDPDSDPNNPDNPDSGNNPNNPNNPDFGTDTVRQIVNQVNAFLGIRILPGLSFRDILLICIALPLLIYILKVFLGG